MSQSKRKRGRPSGIRTCPEFENPSRWTEELMNRLCEIASPKQISAAKTCAKMGRVVELGISPGLIEGEVQGKGKALYEVRLYAAVPDKWVLENVLNNLREKAKYKTALLMGEVPYELDGVFKSSGMSLSLSKFTKSRRWCGCSGSGDICEHILAVLYVAAVAFDRDPFLFMRFRGVEKRKLLELLCAPAGEMVSFAAEEPIPSGLADRENEFETAEDYVPLSVDKNFYGPVDLPDELNAIENLSAEMSRPAHLLEFPLWRGETSFTDSLAPFYKTVKKYLSRS